MINYADVKIDQLNKVHPEREFWLWIYFNYRMLYRGGEEFLRAAGQTTTTRASGSAAQSSPIIDLMAGRNRRRRFLHQLEGEPDTKYISRWERAYYIGYLAAVQDYFRHWLFSQPPAMRPANGDEPPEWFAPFLQDCTGNGDSLVDFIKDVFGDVLTVRKAGWLIGRPGDSVGTTAIDTTGDAPVVLTPYSAEDMLDWQEDTAGELEWILLRKERQIREFPDERKRVETRTFIDRDSWGAWEVSEVNKTDYAELIDTGKFDLGKVPFVGLEVPHGLWPSNKLASWQISIFNQMSMLDYGQLVSCFLQPALTTHEPGSANRIFGEGILLELRGGDGQREAESFQWLSPDVAPLEFSAKRLIDLRDEGYRIVHQMSLAVDSQAIGAIARSGASKIEDRRATEVVLCAFGGYVRKAIIRTLNMISQIVGDNTEWTCDGFDNFEVSSLEEELQTAALISTFNIDSPTFKKEMQKNIATGRILGHIDEQTKETIKKEINDAVDMAEEAKMAPQMMPDGTVLGPPGAPTVQPGQAGMPPMPPKAKSPVPPGPKQTTAANKAS